MTLLEYYLSQRAALKRLLRARLGNDEEAEDLTQELFIKLKRAPTHADDLQNPVGYLFRMALNLARDQQRERRRAAARDGQWLQTIRTTVGSEPIADFPSAESAYSAKQRLARVLAALDGLSPHCRRVFVMHKFEELTHTEISARLGISKSTVEKHMTTALKHLIAIRRD